VQKYKQKYTSLASDPSSPQTSLVAKLHFLPREPSSPQKALVAKQQFKVT
jgi:hypothetical protein